MIDLLRSLRIFGLKTVYCMFPSPPGNGHVIQVLAVFRRLNPVSCSINFSDRSKVTRIKVFR